jgi:NADPH:quinone reductase
VKAVRIHHYGGPEVLVYEEVERPTPGPHQALVRIAAASVNPIDVAVREDRFPTPKALPKTLGSDGAGVVVDLGPDVDGVTLGDEVFFTGLGIGSEGSYAEYALIADTQAVRKPTSVDFSEAASLGLVFATAYYALVHRAAVRAGEVVLVQGAAGGVGSAAVQLAAALGARVVGTVGHDRQAESVRALGAEATIDRHAADLAAQVKGLSGGAGADVVVELHVSANIATDVAAIARGGRIVCIGQGPDPDATVPIGAALATDASLLFMSSGNAGRAGVAQMLREVAALVDEGRLRPVVGHTFPLAEARRAHETLAGHHLGKIVLVP